MNTDKRNLLFLRICFRKWTPFPNTLIILAAVRTDNFGLFHLDPHIFLHKINSP